MIHIQRIRICKSGSSSVLMEDACETTLVDKAETTLVISCTTIYETSTFSIILARKSY